MRNSTRTIRSYVGNSMQISYTGVRIYFKKCLILNCVYVNLFLIIKIRSLIPSPVFVATRRIENRGADENKIVVCPSIYIHLNILYSQGQAFTNAKT